MLDVVELDKVKLKLVPLPSSDQVAGVSSNAVTPLPCATPVPLNDIEPASVCPLLSVRRSNEKVSPPNEKVHNGRTDPLRTASEPSPVKEKSVKVADVPDGMPE